MCVLTGHSFLHASHMVDGRNGKDLTWNAALSMGLSTTEAQRAKECLCYVSMDYQGELKGSATSPGALKARYDLAYQMGRHQRVGAGQPPAPPATCVDAEDHEACAC